MANTAQTNHRIQNNDKRLESRCYAGKNAAACFSSDDYRVEIDNICKREYEAAIKRNKRWEALERSSEEWFKCN